jgi:hypothetical protein
LLFLFLTRLRLLTGVLRFLPHDDHRGPDDAVASPVVATCFTLEKPVAS